MLLSSETKLLCSVTSLQVILLLLLTWPVVYHGYYQCRYSLASECFVKLFWGMGGCKRLGMGACIVRLVICICMVFVVLMQGEPLLGWVLQSRLFGYLYMYGVLWC